jgi:hypothetical protein
MIFILLIYGLKNMQTFFRQYDTVYSAVTQAFPGFLCRRIGEDGFLNWAGYLKKIFENTVITVMKYYIMENIRNKTLN